MAKFEGEWRGRSVVHAGSGGSAQTGAASRETNLRVGGGARASSAPMHVIAPRTSSRTSLAGQEDDIHLQLLYPLDGQITSSAQRRIDGRLPFWASCLLFL